MLSEDYEGALAGTQAGIGLLGAVEDPGVQATCLLCSSMVLIQTGVDLNGGLTNAERAVQLAEQNGDDQLGLAWALVSLAVAAMLCERFLALSEAYEAFLAVPTACEHRTLRAWAEQTAAWAQVSVGSPERALVHIERASTLEGDWPSMTHFQVLGFRIHALARLGQTDKAITTGEQALERARESGALQSVPAIELALATAELLHGALDSAADRAQGLLRMPHLHTLVIAHETLARIALARDQPDEAQRQANELEAIAQRSGSMRHRALADYINGRAAIQTGEKDRGRDLLHAALASCAELGLEREAADVLDELALLAADAGEVERCARMAAAGASTRARLSCAPTLASTERLDSARARLAAQAGDGWDDAWAQGEQAALADAIAYARRGRGRRRRSTAGGWPSLTDTERDVALLAASGKTNPQIAEQLFIARGTVKMHLSSVYRKLDVANRTELAGAVRTAMPPTHNP
jgi:DNA-binding CsgD family transcriptional regulator